MLTGANDSNHAALTTPSSPGTVLAQRPVGAMARAQRTASPLTARHILSILFSRSRLITIVAAVTVLATLFAVATLPAKYHSEAKLMVRLGRESVVIDPTARIGQAAVPQEGRDKEINSEIELLKSRKLTEEIVTRIGPGRILGHAADAPASAKDAPDAIAMIEAKLGVEAIPDSNILAIGFDSSDPELARDVVARLIDAYLDERTHAYRDEGTLKFFQGQLDNARRQQAAAQRALRELRDSTGVANPDQQRSTVLAHMDSLQHDLDSARADLAATTSSIESLGRQIQAMPATHVLGQRTGVAQDSFDIARAKLTEMRLQEVELASRYGDEAKPLKIIRKKIALAEKDVADRMSDNAEQTIGVNHIYEELNLRRESDLATQAALQSRIASLEAAKAKEQSGLAWIEEVAVKSQALEQEALLAAANVSKNAEAYEQARIDTQMGEQRIGNISIAEPPVLPLRAKGPSRGLLAMAGVFLAMSLGLGSAFVADALDQTVRRVDHLGALGLERIVSVPRVDDYYEPYRHATRPAVGPDFIEAAARSIPASDDAEPVAPLRAMMRGSAGGSQTEMDSDLEGGAAHRARAAFDPLDSSHHAGARSSTALSEHRRRPAGPMAVSPQILAAIRGAVDALIPLQGGLSAPRVIGVIGAAFGEGASTMALHLSVALAHRLATGWDDAAQPRVLLLDSDVEAPTASMLAGAPGIAGLADWMSRGTPDLDELARLIVPTRQHQLDLLPAGLPRERSPLAPRTPLILGAMRERYRHVVVDLPSLRDSDSAARMAALCDTVIFVCQSNQLRIEAAAQSLNLLRDAGAHVTLAILNQRRYPIPEWAYRLS